MHSRGHSGRSPLSDRRGATDPHRDPDGFGPRGDRDLRHRHGVDARGLRGARRQRDHHPAEPAGIRRPPHPSRRRDAGGLAAGAPRPAAQRQHRWVKADAVQQHRLEYSLEASTEANTLTLLKNGQVVKSFSAATAPAARRPRTARSSSPSCSSRPTRATARSPSGSRRSRTSSRASAAGPARSACTVPTTSRASASRPATGASVCRTPTSPSWRTCCRSAPPSPSADGGGGPHDPDRAVSAGISTGCDRGRRGSRPGRPSARRRASRAEGCR